MHGLSDTSPEAARVQIGIYRRMPVWRKWKLLADAFVGARWLHAAGVRTRRPAATDADINRDWANVTLGPGPWLQARENPTMLAPGDHVKPIRAVVEAFEALGIVYALGGSMASSVHGVPRYTQDADITAEPFPGNEEWFAIRFPPAEYYADVQMIRDAVRTRSSFNIIHFDTGFKIDVFIERPRRFDRSALARRKPALVFGPGERTFEVVSAEDVLLFKLEWYRLGGETSDRQWGDVMGVVNTRADDLDRNYIRLWAGELGVADLWDRAEAQKMA